MQESNEFYVKGLLNKDSKVINKIYDTFFPKIAAYIKRNNGSSEDAYDIFQEAIMVVFNKAFDNPHFLTAPFEAFLAGVCRLLWLKHLTKQSHLVETGNKNEKKQEKRVINDSDLVYSIMEHGIADSNSVEEDYIITEEQEIRDQRLRSALSGLSSGCQEFIKLKLQGLKNPEIAALKNFKPNYVATQISRCLQNLRELIGTK